MKLNEGQITSVVYTKDGGETSTRIILPSTVPHDTIRAIDLSEINEADRVEMAVLLTDYKQYVKDSMKTIFNFEDWVEHTTQKNISPKWRTFKISGLS